MANTSTQSLLPYGLGLALLATAAHLGWEFTHGGVKTHHLLARGDLPGVSNWWGVLTLPLLGWIASRSVTDRARAGRGTVTNAVAALSGSLLVGAALSLSFAAGYESVTSGLFYGAVVVGLVLPIYRGEYIFGFVLGMTFVFGSVLPMVAVLIAGGTSAVAHFLVRPAFAVLLRKVRS
jgi:hypothetical protein